MEIQDIEIIGKRIKSVFGGTVAEYEATVKINGEGYKFRYQREEPFGYIRGMVVDMPEVTTENTLMPSIVGDELIDHLNG